MSKKDIVAELLEWAKENSGPHGDVSLGDLIAKIRELETSSRKLTARKVNQPGAGFAWKANER